MSAAITRVAATGGGQRGFGLIGAVFLMVVLAGLAAYGVTLTGVQHRGAALTLQGVRAHFAAVSALEWAVARVRADDACPPATPFPIEGFTAVLSGCAFTTLQEGTESFNIYRLEVTASAAAPGHPDYVHRQLQATVSLAP